MRSDDEELFDAPFLFLLLDFVAFNGDDKEEDDSMVETLLLLLVEWRWSPFREVEGGDEDNEDKEESPLSCFFLTRPDSLLWWSWSW